MAEASVLPILRQIRISFNRTASCFPVLRRTKSDSAICNRVHDVNTDMSGLHQPKSEEPQSSSSLQSVVSIPNSKAQQDIGDAKNSKAKVCEYSSKTKNTTEKKKKVKIVPNFFVALQITSDKIKERATDIQTMLLMDYPDLESCRIPVILMHITLLVCRLEKNDLPRASSTISAAVKKLALGPELFNIGVTGVGMFGRRVMYAGVKEGSDTLTEISTELRRSFEENNLVVTDSRELHPHITLMKSRNYKLRFSDECIEKFVNPYTYFGTEKACSLQLCQMKRVDKEGYYIIEEHLDLATGKSIIESQRPQFDFEKPAEADESTSAKE